MGQTIVVIEDGNYRVFMFRDEEGGGVQLSTPPLPSNHSWHLCLTQPGKQVDAVGQPINMSCNWVGLYLHSVRELA